VDQRLVCHLRTEVGAADADVHDVADRLARVAQPGAGADAVGEGGHPVEHGVHIGHDIVAVDLDALALRCPQGDVQHRAVLGDVDVLAAEHRVDAVPQPALLGQRDEEAHRLVGHPVLRVVEPDAGRLRDHPLAAAGVVGEELAEVGLLDRGMVRLERLPRRLFAQGTHSFASSAGSLSDSVRHPPTSARISSDAAGP
jgi:hypothetical protein